MLQPTESGRNTPLSHPFLVRQGRVRTGTAQPHRQRDGSQELPGTGELGLDCITAGAVTSTNLLHLSRFASSPRGAGSYRFSALASVRSQMSCTTSRCLTLRKRGHCCELCSSQHTHRFGASLAPACRLGNGCSVANQAWMVSKPISCRCCHSPLGPQDTQFSGPVSPPWRRSGLEVLPKLQHSSRARRHPACRPSPLIPGLCAGWHRGSSSALGNSSSSQAGAGGPPLLQAAVSCPSQGAQSNISSF